MSEGIQLCPTLCDPVDCSLPGSPVHGIFQARILEWVAISFSKASSQPRDQTWVSHHRQILYHWVTQKAKKGYRKGKESEVAQSCLTLCDPMDCSLPGPSAHGIFQAIVLEWIAISFSSGSSRPRDGTQVSRIVDRRFTVWATRKVQNYMFISSFRFSFIFDKSIRSEVWHF